MISSSKGVSGFSISCIQEITSYSGCETEYYIPVYYKQFLYLIQCYTSLPERQQKIHILNTNNNTWKVQATIVGRNGNKNGLFFPKQNCARVLVGNILYCFGGRDSKGKSDNRLSSFNLEKKTWKTDIDVAASNTAVHIVPENRINGNLVAFRQKFLILFGGVYNMTDTVTLNTLWVFDLQGSYWNKVPNFTFGITNPSVSISSDKMYIFGSKLTESVSMNSLYEFTIQINEQSDKPTLTFQKVQKISTPDKEECTLGTSNSYKLLTHNQKVLFLFQNLSIVKGLTRSSIIKLWLFDTLTKNWQKTQLQFYRQANQIIYDELNSFYLFDFSKRIDNILKIVLTQTQFKKVKNYIRHRQWRKCQICFQIFINNNKLMQPAFKISKQLLQSLTQKIRFPFAAFGIFAEIALNHTANYINFQYTNYKQSPILRIQDDNHSNYTNQQFQQVIVNFAAETNYNFGSVQRRVRSLLYKDFIKKQYGTNLKLASMRLGSQMLYISLTPNYQARVAYFVMEQGEYVCYYYAFDEKTNKVVDDYSTQAKLYVQSKYLDLINEALHQSPGSLKYAPYKNTTIILGLKKMVNQFGQYIPELQPFSHSDQKDILYIPNQMIYKKYMDYGCKLNDSIDVSLANYLSNLFLKNQHMKITLQIHQYERRWIKRQQTLQTTDKNTFMKVVSSVDFLLKNFDLKSVDLMFNSKLNKKLGVFHNGVLIYHKNRLIKRFGCQFGNLLEKIQETDKLSFGYFNVFGKIQLPDSLQVNQQKTDFANQIMLEKIYSRLKFIHQLLAKSIDNQKEDSKSNNNFKQGPKLRSRFEDYQSKPVKKVKRHHDDQSYNAN